MFPLLDRSNPRLLLAPDDVQSAFRAYPNLAFRPRPVRVSGSVTMGSAPAPGLNVIFESMDGPEPQAGRGRPVYLSVSGFSGSGSDYEVVIEPGNYRISVETITPGFFDKHSVGPFANKPDDVSFQYRTFGPRKEYRVQNIPAGAVRRIDIPLPALPR
jgi:hypothetical protein